MPTEKDFPFVTFRVSHDANFNDIPGRPYQPAKVSYIIDVYEEYLDMDHLLKFSQALGYSTIGEWHYLDDDTPRVLRMLPIRNEKDINHHLSGIHKRNFTGMESLYVEHPLPKISIFYPKNLMETPCRRMEKLVYLLLAENPSATVEEATNHVQDFMKIWLPRQQMEAAVKWISKRVCVLTG
ncbi:hypothetical protein OROGR_027960 [Orobanche gracilis]